MNFEIKRSTQHEMKKWKNDWHRDRQDRHINGMRKGVEAWEGWEHMAVTCTTESGRAGLGLKLAKVQDIRKGKRMVMNRGCVCALVMIWQQYEAKRLSLIIWIWWKMRSWYRQHFPSCWTCTRWNSLHHNRNACLLWMSQAITNSLPGSCRERLSIWPES